MTSGGIDKLQVYQGLGVTEVWFWQDGGFQLYQLQDHNSQYVLVKYSKLLPDLDFDRLATYIKPNQEPEMLKAFRKAIG